jgi:hypothetical protein
VDAERTQNDGEGPRNSGRNCRQGGRVWEECGEMRLKWPRRQRDSDSHELGRTVKSWIALSIGCIPNFSLYCIWVRDEQPSKCLNSIRQESGGQELGDEPRRIVSSIPLQCHKHRIGQLNFSWTVFLLREDGCKAARVSAPNGRVGYVVPRPEKGNEKFLLCLVVTNMRRTYTSSKSRTAPPLGSGGHMIVEKTLSRGDCAIFVVVEKRLNPFRHHLQASSSPHLPPLRSSQTLLEELNDGRERTAYQQAYRNCRWMGHPPAQKKTGREVVFAHWRGR